MIVDKDKQYRTKSGNEVRIYETNNGGAFPVHGAVLEDGIWMLKSWRSHGCKWHDDKSDYDLVEIKPRIKRTMWVNVYPDGVVEHETRKSADSVARKERIACVKVDFECEKGEGL
jgi:hypothetical protein